MDSDHRLKHVSSSKGFSLAELLVALTIGAMVLVTTITIYGRAQRASESVKRNLDRPRLASEVMQKIAEDLDRVPAAGSDTKLVVAWNKLEHSYPTARLEIQKTVYDKQNKKQMLEEIIWQAGYNYDGVEDGLVLYRSYRGLIKEDKLLDDKRESWENDYSFIPICSGLTYFKIEVPVGEELKDEWTGSAPPKAIIVTMSFAEPYESVSGGYEVDEEDKVKRTIAISRTRKVAFKIERRAREEELKKGLSRTREDPNEDTDEEEDYDERRGPRDV